MTLYLVLDAASKSPKASPVACDELSFYYLGGSKRIILFPSTTLVNSSSHPAVIAALTEAEAKERKEQIFGDD